MCTGWYTQGCTVGYIPGRILLPPYSGVYTGVHLPPYPGVYTGCTTLSYPGIYRVYHSLIPGYTIGCTSLPPVYTLGVYLSPTGVYLRVCRVVYMSRYTSGCVGWCICPGLLLSLGEWWCICPGLPPSLGELGRFYTQGIPPSLGELGRMWHILTSVFGRIREDVAHTIPPSLG